MADLDLFKKVNDTYGHDAGDTVLKSFSEILKSNTRQSDMCARLDHLGVLRDKIECLRLEIADIQELNQQFRRDGGLIFASSQLSSAPTSMANPVQ